MNELEPQEHQKLVALFKSLSPSSLSLTPPSLGSEFLDLVNRPLPHSPKAYLFDIYGTLVVSAAGGEANLPGDRESKEGLPAKKILEQALRDMGYSGGPTAFDRAFSTLIVTTRKKMFAQTDHPEVNVEKLLGQLFPSASPADLRYLAVVHEAWKNPCAPMPGASEVLWRLQKKGVPLGLISNAQFYTPLLMEALFEKSLDTLGFDTTLSFFSYERGIAKPDTGAFTLMAKELAKKGISPDQALYIGNSSVNDMAPAGKLGFMTALFAGDTRSFRPSPPGTEGSRPDRVLLNFKDLD